MRIAEIFALFRKSGSRNTMVTSDFRPEMEIQQFPTCDNYKNSSFTVDGYGVDTTFHRTNF